MLDVKAYCAWDETAVTSVIVPKLIPRALRVLDELAVFVDEHVASKVDAVVEALQQGWETLAHEGSSQISPDIACGSEGPVWIRHYPKLREVAHRFFRGCFASDASVGTDNQPTLLLGTELCRASYLPRHLMLKAQVDALGHETGIACVKECLDGQTASRSAPASPPDTLEELRARDIPWNVNDGGQDAVSVLVTKYTCLRKVTACRIHKVLAPYGDPELMEVIACYPDHASIRRANGHFSLTRTQGLIGGAEYCDTCFHDDRAAQPFGHPSRDVFDALGRWLERGRHAFEFRGRTGWLERRGLRFPGGRTRPGNCPVWPRERELGAGPCVAATEEGPGSVRGWSTSPAPEALV